jgi:hypothetical protein
MKIGDLVRWKKEYEDAYSKNVGLIVAFMKYDYTLVGCPYDELLKADCHDLKVLSNGTIEYWTSKHCEVLNE